MLPSPVSLRAALIAVAALALPAAAPAEPARHELSHGAMGTLFRVIIYGPEREATEAAHAAFHRIDALEAALSDYRAASELRRLEREAASAPFAPGSDLLAVLEEAQRIARGTDGAFDPTVGALTRLWRWAARRGIEPPAARLAEARATVGYGALRIDPSSRTVTIDRPGVRLDLGGIAKGYAVDAAYAVLERRGFPAALVDGGGDLRIGHAPPGSDGWRVALPRAGADGIEWQTTTLADVSVATSGGTYRTVGTAAERRSHVLDPRTGRGVPAGRISTVMAATAMRADALASALDVLGQAGLETVRTLGASDARIIESGGP